MSVLHRVEEIEEMPGPRFFAYCYRLADYPGVVAAKYRRQPGPHTGTAPAAAPVPRTMSLAEWVEQHPHEMDAAYERAAEGR